MTVSQSTRKSIDDLAKAIVEGLEKDYSMPGAVVLKTSSPVPDIEGNEPNGLFLIGREARLFQKALGSLQNDPAVEHLTRANLSEALIALAQDLESNRPRTKSGSALRQRINNFVSDLARPLIRFEVAFSIESVTFPMETLTFGDVVFREFTLEVAEEWGFPKATSLSRKMHDKLVGQPVGIVTVDAGSSKKAAERAQESLERALNTLRFCIGSITRTPVWDSQLLQRRGQFRAIREVSPQKKFVSTGGGRTSTPIDLEFAESLAGSTAEFMRQLAPIYDGTIQARLRDALFRSIEWIGTSITRESYDHKVVDLCTALEAALTTINDGRKGQAIALRSMLLSMAVDEPFFDPRELYVLYKLRSRVVHGAALGECGENDYIKLRQMAERVVLNIIKLNSTQREINRPWALIGFLESPERVDEALTWLVRWQDDDTKAVADYAKLKSSPADKVEEG